MTKSKKKSNKIARNLKKTFLLIPRIRFSFHSVVARDCTASTSTGNKFQHKKEEHELMEKAIMIGWKQKVFVPTNKFQNYPDKSGKIHLKPEA